MGDLGRFKKMLGGLGKRIYNWRETKESMNFLSYMYQSIVEEYADIFNGDYEKSMDTLIDLVRPMSAEVVSKLLLEVKVMGVPFKSYITKNLEDLPYIIETALYAVYGSWSKKMFEKPVYIPASKSEYGVDTIVLKYNQCPYCCNTMIPAEKFGKHHYGKLQVLTIEQMTQVMQDFAGNDFEVIGRETKCFHRGDDYGEIQLWLYPRSNPQLREKNELLKLIK
ncbi:MAG: hypothetical protein ACTSQI_06575 [Candidatus Helarchaeota archaeon]